MADNQFTGIDLFGTNEVEKKIETIHDIEGGETTFPPERPNQCIYLLKFCKKCGQPYGNSLTCKNCGSLRRRCTNTAIKDNACYSHNGGDNPAIYTKLFNKLGDVAVDNLMEGSTSYNLNAEFAIARMLLAKIGEENTGLDVSEQMDMVKKLFEIAKLKKTLETDGATDILWDSNVVTKINTFIGRVFSAIKESGTAELLKLGISKSDTDATIETILRDVADAVKQNEGWKKKKRENRGKVPIQAELIDG